LDTPSYRG